MLRSVFFGCCGGLVSRGMRLFCQSSSGPMVHPQGSFCSAELARAVRTALGGVDISFQPNKGGELMSVQFENLLLGELRTAYSAKAGKMITIPLHEPHERFGIK